MERDEGQKPIVVEFGYPFSINPPDFTEPIADRGDEFPLMGSTEFELDGKFKGRVNIVINRGFLQYYEYYEGCSLNFSHEVPATPAGPIETRHTLEGNNLSLEEGSLPAELNVELDNLQRGEIPTLQCQLTLGGKTFRGSPSFEFTDEDKQEAVVDFFLWRDLETKSVGPLFFPQDAEVFSKIQIMFFREPYPPRG